MPEPAAIGIDVGGTKLVAASVHSDGQLEDRLRRDTPARDPDLLVATLGEVIGEFRAGLHVGLGIAGLVTTVGEVAYGPNIGVRDLPLAGLLTAAAGVPVTVVNDASAAALGEQRIGAGRGRHDVMMVTLGTGVGGGIVIGGELLVGRHGFAGELGHVIVQDGGRPCPCGNRGCLEAYASGTSLALTAQERLADPAVVSSLRDGAEVTGRAITVAARAGDALAQEILTTAGHWLGVAVATLVNSVDPEVVLVGGGAAVETAEWILPAAQAALDERVIGAPQRVPPRLELAALGDDAGMVGAGLLAIERAEQQLGPRRSGVVT